MKIVTIVGARPQFIKAGTVSRELAKYQQIEEILVHTGQHYDSNMSEIFFNQMSIPKPKYNLNIGGVSHGEMTGEMIKKIEEILLVELPDFVMVYGDTNSTLAGAIAASKLHIKIFHVESGLRSNNMMMPEEINRILTDRVSSLLFCPTDESYRNLLSEGLDNWKAKAVICGDVMQDGAFFYKDLAQPPNINNLSEQFILTTIHRAENTDNKTKLMDIFEALGDIANSFQVILPLHPRTKEKIHQHSIKINPKIKLIDPVGYLNMVWLLQNCNLVITDSGGLQKESFFYSKPCITVRDETEWVELVDAGVNILAGSSKKNICNAFNYLSQKNSFIFDQNLYGNGNAAKEISKEILKNLI